MKSLCACLLESVQGLRRAPRIHSGELPTQPTEYRDGREHKP
jgi:hypothetical protein